MAEITRVNGDVFSGVEINTAVGGLVVFNGSQIKAFAVVVKNVSGTAVDIRAEANALEAIEKIFQAITLVSTIVYYQVENTTAGQISMIIEAQGGGWTAAAMQTAIRALGTTVGANNIDVSGTTVTDVGLKLALS